MPQPYPLRQPAVCSLEEPSDKMTYEVPFVLAPTAAMDLVAIAAPAGRVLRVKAIRVDNPGLQTGAAAVTLAWGYATAVGSGGAAATPGNFGAGDGDAASLATARRGDTAQAAGFVQQGELHVFVPAAAGAFQPYEERFWSHAKSPSYDASKAAAVFVLRHPGAAGAAGFSGVVIFTEEPL